MPASPMPERNKPTSKPQMLRARQTIRSLNTVTAPAAMTDCFSPSRCISSPPKTANRAVGRENRAIPTPAAAGVACNAAASGCRNGTMVPIVAMLARARR